MLFDHKTDMCIFCYDDVIGWANYFKTRLMDFDVKIHPLEDLDQVKSVPCLGFMLIISPTFDLSSFKILPKLQKLSKDAQLHVIACCGREPVQGDAFMKCIPGQENQLLFRITDDKNTCSQYVKDIRKRLMNIVQVNTTEAEASTATTLSESPPPPLPRKPKIAERGVVGQSMERKISVFKSEPTADDVPPAPCNSESGSSTSVYSEPALPPRPAPRKQPFPSPTALKPPISIPDTPPRKRSTTDSPPSSSFGTVPRKTSTDSAPSTFGTSPRKTSSTDSASSSIGAVARKTSSTDSAPASTFGTVPRKLPPSPYGPKVLPKPKTDLKSPDLPTDTGNVTVFPEEIRYGEELLILLKVDVSATELLVWLENKRSNHREKARAEQLQKNVFKLKFDGLGIDPGLIKVDVYDDHAFLGRGIITYRSVTEQLVKLLDIASNPVQLMADCLDVDSDNTASLDRCLANRLKGKTPKKLAQVFKMRKDLERAEEGASLPTVLHLAAQYNLPELTKQLLKLPGSEQALDQPNNYGMTPVELAEKNGNGGILNIFDEFQTKSSEGDEIYQSLIGKSLDSDLGSSMEMDGPGRDVNKYSRIFFNKSNQDDSLYEQMNFPGKDEFRIPQKFEPFDPTTYDIYSGSTWDANAAKTREDGDIGSRDILNERPPVGGGMLGDGSDYMSMREGKIADSYVDGVIDDDLGEPSLLPAPPPPIDLNQILVGNTAGGGNSGDSSSEPNSSISSPRGSWQTWESSPRTSWNRTDDVISVISDTSTLTNSVISDHSINETGQPKKRPSMEEIMAPRPDSLKLAARVTEGDPNQLRLLELLQMQKDFKEGRFTEKETQMRFQDWKRKYPEPNKEEKRSILSTLKNKFSGGGTGKRRKSSLQHAELRNPKTTEQLAQHALNALSKTDERPESTISNTSTMSTTSTSGSGGESHRTTDGPSN